MKFASMTFAALFTSSLSAHALYLPGNIKTPIYHCQGQQVETRIIKENTGETTLVVNEINDQQTLQVMEAPVTELSNKSQIVYTSDDVVLKMNHHPSGLMPAALFISQNGEAQKIDLNCQAVFQIMNNISDL